MLKLFLLLFVSGFAVLHSQSIGDVQQDQIIFISDTQSPIWIEKLYLDYNDNELARDLIANDIIDQSPKSVFHLGDLVSFGHIDDDWDFMDKFLDNLRDNKIPFFPTLGNHELMNWPREGEANFMRRFPDYVKTGYTRKMGSTAVILLNSNFDHLSEFLIQKQQDWFEHELSTLDNDNSVDHVIVGCHHSPFTNSSMVSGSEEVRQQFVSLFSLYEKCRLFISGHAHRFEHFIINSKNFIVAGGGGGMQHPVDDNEIEFPDQYIHGSDPRPFHYITIDLGEVLEVAVRSVSPRGDSISENYSFKLNQSPGKVIARNRDVRTEK